MRHLLPGLVAVLAVGCATTKSAEPAPGAAPPAATPPAGAPAAPSKEQKEQDLRAMFSREVDVQAQQQFVLGDKRVTVESAAPVVTKEGQAGEARLVNLSLGTGQAVNCFLYPEGVDVGALLTKLLGSLSGSMAISAVRVADMTLVEASPATFVEVLYVVKKDQGQLLGMLKLMLYSHDDAPLMCMHDEPGYGKSFQRLGSTFAGAMARALTDPSVRYGYRSVSFSKVKGMPVGFERSAWVKRADGSTTIVTVSMSAVPRTKTDVMTSDGVSVVQVGKDGFVTEKTDIHLANGEVERKLKLTRGKGGAYHYAGEQQGKALEGDVKTADGKGIWSDVLVARSVKALDAKKPSVSYEDYLGSVNPGALTRVTMTRDAAAPNAVTMEAGPLKLATLIDAAGMPEALSLPVGPLTLEQQRVFVEGKPE